MDKKNYNYGVEILRVFLAFMVVIDHFYKNKKKYIYTLYYHIPTFFIISFYFTYNTLVSFIIPYIAWSIIAWALRNIYYYLFHLNYGHSLELFIKHLVTGHIFIIAFWYQANLILMTILFLIIIFLFKKNRLLIFHILTLIAHILQYSGFNFFIFKTYLQSHAKLSFGRFVEVFPNAVTGFTFASLIMIEKLKKNRMKAIILLVISIYFKISKLINMVV